VSTTVARYPNPSLQCRLFGPGLNTNPGRRQLSIDSRAARLALVDLLRKPTDLEVALSRVH